MAIDLQLEKPAVAVKRPRGFLGVFFLRGGGGGGPPRLLRLYSEAVTEPTSVAIVSVHHVVPVERAAVRVREDEVGLGFEPAPHAVLTQL